VNLLWAILKLLVVGEEKIKFLCSSEVKSSSSFPAVLAYELHSVFIRVIIGRL